MKLMIMGSTMKGSLKPSLANWKVFLFSCFRLQVAPWRRLGGAVGTESKRLNFFFLILMSYITSSPHLAVDDGPWCRTKGEGLVVYIYISRGSSWIGRKPNYINPTSNLTPIWNLKVLLLNWPDPNQFWSGPIRWFEFSGILNKPI